MGKRSRWFAFDADFLGGSVGCALRDELGGAGIAVFVAFLAACKRGHVEGQISYTNEHDAIALLGLTGMPMTRPDGSAFTLDDVWKLLGRYKQVRRTSRGRVTYVRSTRWERWQNVRGTSRQREGKGRSTPDSADTDTDTNTDKDTNTDQTAAQAAAILAEAEAADRSDLVNRGGWVVWRSKELLPTLTALAVQHPSLSPEDLARLERGDSSVLHPGQRFVPGTGWVAS